MMTLASQTPLIGGGGIDTFMNRAFALPSTGVGYTAARGAPGDRVVISAPYTLGGAVTFKTEPFILTLAIIDPRSAIDPAVIENPFAKGRAWGAALTVPTELFGLRGFQTLRGAYSDAYGINLDTIADLRPPHFPAR
jgi:porin